jgi:hypothetical protein
MPFFWTIFANSAASVAFGVLGFILLKYSGSHRDNQNRLASIKISACVLQSIAAYTLAICIFGHWFLKIPISMTIREGFGDERAAWLLLGVLIDVLVRLYGLFDPD